MQIILRWLGNAGFEFQIEETTILVDPFLTRPKPHNIIFGRVQPDQAALQKHVPRCDHILVTHAHFDHCMDAPEIALRTGARVHGSANTCRLMLAAGLPEEQIHEIRDGDEFRLGKIAIKVLPAAHPWIVGYTRGRLNSDLRFPLRLRDYRMDDCFNFLLQTGDERILVWSSTQTKGAPGADVITCRAVSSQRWYQRLLNDVEPAWVIPQHWDDTFQPLSDDPRPFFTAPRLGIPPLQRIDLSEFREQVLEAYPRCQVLLPKIFKEYRPE